MQHQNITTVPGPQMLLCKQNFLPLVSMGAGGAGGAKAFLVHFVTTQAPYDSVSSSLLTTVLDATRYGYAGGVFGQDVLIIEAGKVLTNGAYSQYVPYAEDTGNWTGSGPWTRSINLTVIGTYIVSTDLSGATIDITAGTATIDASAQATFGSPDQFVVTGAGTITITTDTADPKAQITNTPYKLPYAINTTSGIKSVPLNYSDADEGIKAIGIAANFPQLYAALYGTDGTDAEALITIPWTPRFDAADVSGVVHILTANNDATSFLFYNGATQEIHAYDGTNTAVVACTPVNDTEYQIILNYGDDNGQKMWLTVDTTVGLQVTHAGSFPHTADDLSVAWEEEVPQEIGSIIILKEPVLMVPPASPPTGFDWVVDSGEGYILDDAGNYIYA